MKWIRSCASFSTRSLGISSGDTGVIGGTRRGDSGSTRIRIRCVARVRGSVGVLPGAAGHGPRRHPLPFPSPPGSRTVLNGMMFKGARLEGNRNRIEGRDRGKMSPGSGKYHAASLPGERAGGEASIRLHLDNSVPAGAPLERWRGSARTPEGNRAVVQVDQVLCIFFDPMR